MSPCLLKPGKVLSRQMNRFASAPISFPNAGADSHCRVMPTQIGLKQGDNCSPRLVAELKAFNHESTQRDRIFLQKETKARKAIRFQDRGFVLFIIFCTVRSIKWKTLWSI